MTPPRHPMGRDIPATASRKGRRQVAAALPLRDGRLSESFSGVTHDYMPASAKRDVTVQVLSTFKRLLSEGALKPGARLPAERELAENFQVSRSSLRQALKVLEIFGVISQRVGDGTYVNDVAGSILSEPLNFLILLNGISFQEIMDARLIVEPELAARAAERATPEVDAALRYEMEAMKQCGDNHELVSKHDVRFHDIIFESAGNRVCGMLFKVIHETLDDLVKMTSQLVSVDHTLYFHRRIYDTIVARQPDEARKRMQEHLWDVNALLTHTDEERMATQLQNRISELARPTRQKTPKP